MGKSVKNCTLEPGIVAKEGIEAESGLVPHLICTLDRKLSAGDTGHEAGSYMCATNCSDGLGAVRSWSSMVKRKSIVSKLEFCFELTNPHHRKMCFTKAPNHIGFGRQLGKT